MHPPNSKYPLRWLFRAFPVRWYEAVSVESLNPVSCTSKNVIHCSNRLNRSESNNRHNSTAASRAILNTGEWFKNPLQWNPLVKLGYINSFAPSVFPKGTRSCRFLGTGPDHQAAVSSLVSCLLVSVSNRIATGGIHVQRHRVRIHPYVLSRNDRKGVEIRVELARYR